MSQSILVVDDSRTILLSLRNILTKQGYVTRTAIGGTEALGCLDEGFTPDLIITDLHMPGMSGIDLIEALRERSDARFTPILMLTTETGMAKREEAKKAGATGWLVKPVRPRRLVDILKRVMPPG